MMLTIFNQAAVAGHGLTPPFLPFVYIMSTGVAIEGANAYINYCLLMWLAMQRGQSKRYLPHHHHLD